MWANTAELVACGNSDLKIGTRTHALTIAMSMHKFQ